MGKFRVKADYNIYNKLINMYLHTKNAGKK